MVVLLFLRTTLSLTIERARTHRRSTATNAIMHCTADVLSSLL
jgi:hypothetical protein